ncbi:MAG: 3-hydroxyacyl-ACP dehydratase FabZ [Bauldia sp.]
MNDEAKKLESFDIRRLYELLPHRFPFLMVDRIIDVDSDNSAIGIKNVSSGEPYFAGHFPNYPVMPGVLIVEGIAQTAGAICVAARATTTPQIVYFMTIDDAKFRKPVLPGDTLHYHVKKLRNRGNIWKFAGEARVGGVMVAEAVVSALVTDE